MRSLSLAWCLCVLCVLCGCGCGGRTGPLVEADAAVDPGALEAPSTEVGGCLFFERLPLTEQTTALDVEFVRTNVLHFAVGPMDLELVFAQLGPAYAGSHTAVHRSNDAEGFVGFQGANLSLRIFDRPSPCERDRSSMRLEDRRCDAHNADFLLTDGVVEVSHTPDGATQLRLHDLAFAEVRVAGARYVAVPGGRCVRVRELAVNAR